MSAKVLLIGQNGQVSNYIQAALENDASIELHVAGRDRIDLSEPQHLAVGLAEYNADVIINPAAYTAVDLAEEERELAFVINRDAVAELAKYSADNNVPLIHFSTDYVFAGDSETPYLEHHEPAPTGVYGASKLAGEKAILESQAPAVILRTAWVYSNHGKNFYKTMLKLSESRTELSVVSDQIGAPTYAGSIAESSRRILKKIIEQDAVLPHQKGVFHFSCQGQTSWCDFAKAIFVENQINSMQVKPITTQDYPTPAKRPAYSVLDGSKLQEVFDISLPHWGTALAQCAAETAKLKT